MRPLPLAALLLTVPVALGVLPGAVAAPGAKAPKPVPRVVVADVDSGINPYHEAFYRGPSEVTPAVLAEFPGVRSVRLTRTGDLAADLAADKPFWDSVELGEPYWFVGTNVIGVSFDPSTPTRIFSDEGDEHGTGTAAAVLDANPEAVLLFVEGTALADAETYAFTHPAVDVVTTSYGIPGSPPVPSHLVASYEGVVERGKLHFGAADNSPALSPVDGTSGPWWSIGVAGFHEDTSRGRETLSGNLVDLVSDFTQELPYCSDCETGRQPVSGTSFATPRSAGTASKVLLEARRAAGHRGGPVVRPGAAPLLVTGRLTLTGWQLRRAFEQAAAYPTSEGYDLARAVTEDTAALPVLDAAPWLQTGWGVFSPDPQFGVVAEALARLGVRGRPTRDKPAQACEVNTAAFDLRAAYWDRVAVGSASFGTTAESPYLRCG